MNKAELRQHMLQQLKQLSNVQKQELESAIHHRLWVSSLWLNSDVIGMTYSQPYEWNTYPLMEKAWEQNKTVVLPKTEPKDRSMTFYTVENKNQLQTGYANILEPDPNVCQPMPHHAIDLVIVPGILFNKEGYRIGFGGGYYDRFLVYYQGNTVSLLSQKQLVHHLPTEKFDIPVANLITETNVYSIAQT